MLRELDEAGRTTWASFLRIKIGKINVMDKIWDRKSFEVGGHWPLWRGSKNRMTKQNRQKSNAKKTTTKNKQRHILLKENIFNHQHLYSHIIFVSELGIWTRPRKGRALMWNNMSPGGECESLSIHRANKVLKGHKFILQRW